MNNAQLITSAQGLQDLADRLGEVPVVACDLEADSLHRYQEKVCLLQFSVPGFSALLDPLALPDLSPLAAMFANPAIRKVFHGADYDVRSLHRDFGLVISNLFDTMIASQFLGEAELGLAASLRKRFAVELDKRFQKADWSRRPLPPEMLGYAQEDTRYLIDFSEQLITELGAKGRLDWVLEECSFLERVRVVAREPGPFFLRFKGALRFDRRTLAVLEELLRFRNDEARRADRPHFKVIGNETLAELARQRPARLDTACRIPGLTETMIHRYGQGLERAIRHGLALPEAKLPSFPIPPRFQRDPRQEARVKRLKEWRATKACQLALDPGLLANNALLEAMASLADGAPVEGVIPRCWQRQLFADELTTLLN